MNENKFLKNLNQKNTSSPPVAAGSSSSSAPPAPPSVPNGYDPIQRLVDELSRQNTAIEGLNKRFDRWEKLPRGASQAELEALMQAARQGIDFKLDSKRTAELMLPELTRGMPTLSNLKTATDEGVNELRAVGLATAERIEEASRTAAHRIEWASRSKANAWANRVGFTSWQSALVVFVLLLVVGGGVAFYVHSHQQEIQAMRIQDNATKEFAGWIQDKYPEVWKAYLRKVNP
ncbi:MAG: hypothetical protein DSM106950_37375 [Stigonema ocellatum SAG 48.90 = DSM 106950]|nr:hypothetical protein [Stigonema ocellatum SAG 48.90 = DSM 106950]